MRRFALFLALLAGRAAAETSGLHAEAHLTKAQAWMGEEIIYTARLVSETPFRDVTFRPPEFPGFSQRQLPPVPPSRSEADGRPAWTVELRYLLVPARPGRREIGPATFSCGVETGDPSSGRDPFFDRSGTEQREATAGPLSVATRPLPRRTAASPFSGLVGSFHLEARVAPGRVAVGRPAGVIVTVEGTGAPVSGLGPLAQANPGCRLYLESEEEEARLAPEGTALRRVYRFALVPERPGRLVVGPFSLLVFDPARGRYERLTTASLSLAVTGQAATPPPLPGRSAAQKPSDTRDRRASDRSLSPIPFLALWLLPGLLFGALRGASAHTPRSAALQATEARRLLRQARQEEDPANLHGLYRALAAAIGAAAGRVPSAGALTPADARSALPTPLGDRAARLLARLEAARFGGRRGSGDLAGETIATVRALLRPPWRTRVAGAAWVAALTGCIGAAWLAGPRGTAPPAQGTAATLVARGMAALVRRDPAAATLALETAVRAGYRNAWLFADLGKAYLGAGDVGRAVLWTERAAQLRGDAGPVGAQLRRARAAAGQPKASLSPAHWAVLAVRRPGLGVWQAFALLLAAGFWGLLALDLRRAALGVVAGLALGAAAVPLGWAATDHLSSAAVVLAPSVSARSGLSDRTTELFCLGAGTIVTVERRLGTRLCVTPDGDRLGWIPAEAVASIREQDSLRLVTNPSAK